MNIPIECFHKQFQKEYDFLYKNNNNVAGYDEAVDAFEDFVRGNAGFVREYVAFRGDFISSDREAAAFMFALSTFM